MNWFRAIWSAVSKRAVSYWSDKLSWGGLVSPGMMSNAGVIVTPDRALGLTAYFAAVNRISTDVASLPLRVYRRRKRGGADVVADHAIAELLSHSPDGETTSMRWRQAYQGHVLGWGNGYAEIEFDRGGRPIGLYLLDPSTTFPDRRPQDRRLFYRVGQTDQVALPTTIPPHRVLHVAGLGFNGLKGYSVATYAREAIGLGMAAERFGGAFFGNGSRPSGVLELPYKLKDKAAVDQLKLGWNTEYAGPDNAGKVAVLEQGAKFTPTSIPPEDAQFLQTRQFQVIEIARLFGIPPHKLGDYSQAASAYRALEETNLDYLTTTIRPWCEAIEQEMARKLLSEEERRRGFYVAHDMSAFLRGNMQARADFYTKLRDLGVYTPNLICRLENLPPVGPEGDVRLVSKGLVPLADAGKPPAPAPAPQPPPGPGEDDDDQAEDDETAPDAETPAEEAAEEEEGETP